MSNDTTQEGTQKVPFNPNDHLTDLKSKAGIQKYLEVKWRIVWFRDHFPHGTIDTEEVEVDPDRECEVEAFVWNPDTRKNEKGTKKAKGYARYKAVVTDGQGGRATGTKTENAANFPDYVEKAETGSIGRALANLGFGTQFTGDEYDEGERIVDAPVDPQPPQGDPPPIPPTTPKTKAPAPVGGETGTEKKKASAPIPASPSTPTPVVTSTPTPVPVDLAVLRQQANETLTTAAPYEALAILSWSGIEETNPDQWSAEMCRLITANTEKWFDGEHHDQWIAKSITQKQYDEITKTWVAIFGGDAIKALKTSLFGETCPPVSKLTRGQADMLVEQLRNAEPKLVDGKIVPKRETVTLTAAAA